MLGHSTIAITLDTYSQVAPSMQRDAAARMDAAIRSIIDKPHQKDDNIA